MRDHSIKNMAKFQYSNADVPIATDVTGEGFIRVVEKPKSNSEASIYIMKPLQESDADSMASLEALAGDLWRFIIGVERAPKTRVLAKKTNALFYKPLATLSKVIPGFESLDDLLHADDQGWLNEMLTSRQEALAALFVGMYVMEDCDQRPRHCGFDKNSKLCKIGHDSSFWFLSSKYKGIETDISPDTKNLSYLLKCLEKWPNFLYSADTAFEFISARDLLNLVNLVDAKPWNSLSYFIPELKRLSNDPVYMKWQFFYLLKSILLQETLIRAIAVDHYIIQKIDKINPELQKVIQHISKKIATLTKILCRMPEFQLFMKEQMPNLMEKMWAQVEAYNLDFETKSGQIKSGKTHRHIRYDQILERIEYIQQQCQLELDNSSAETSNNYKLEECLVRYTREKQALEKVQSILQGVYGILSELNPEQEQIVEKIHERCLMLEKQKQNSVDACEAEIAALKPRVPKKPKARYSREHADRARLRQRIFAKPKSDFASPPTADTTRLIL